MGPVRTGVSPPIRPNKDRRSRVAPGSRLVRTTHGNDGWQLKMGMRIRGRFGDPRREAASSRQYWRAVSALRDHAIGQVLMSLGVVVPPAPPVADSPRRAATTGPATCTTLSHTTLANASYRPPWSRSLESVVLMRQAG